VTTRATSERSTTEQVALARSDRLQPALLLASIAVGAGLAAVTPGPAARAAPLVSIGVFALLYLVMLGIDPRGLTAALTQRRFVAAAVTINFVIHPLLAWGLGATFLRDQPDLRVGLLLFLVTPCIGWYLIFTDLARGDTQLGVALLGINLGLQILLLPVYLQLFAGQSASIDPATVIRSAATYLVVPFALASGTRHLLTVNGTSIEHLRHRLRLDRLKTVTLMAVIIAMFASQGEALLDNPTIVLRLLPPIAAFFAISFVVALLAARALRLTYPHTALLVFTTSARNSEASLAIAATAFASPLVSLSVVIGPAVELPLLVLFVRLLDRLRRP
jgi:arsenite transporter